MNETELKLKLDLANARILELEGRIFRRNSAIRKLEEVILDLRYRVGEGFREEIRSFSDSIKLALSK